MQNLPACSLRKILLMSTVVFRGDYQTALIHALCLRMQAALCSELHLRLNCNILDETYLLSKHNACSMRTLEMQPKAQWKGCRCACICYDINDAYPLAII